jgi:hypothetical protein
MVRAVEIIVIIALMVFSFFLGVKYANKVKTHLNWLQHQEEQEIDLPDVYTESPESEIPYSPEDEGDATNISNINAIEMPATTTENNDSTTPAENQDIPAVNESEEVKPQIKH